MDSSNMGSIVERFRIWWGNLEKSQRPVWAVSAILVLVLFVGAAMFAGKPQMSMLFGGLSPADQGMVVEELGKLGIKADYDNSGNVLVPTPKVAEARAKLALAKKLPNTGSLGYGSLDSIGMVTSPAVEREKIKASKEGELTNSIRSMTGVADVRVHLSLGEDSPFLRDTKPPTASIIITPERGARFGSEQSVAIARLVQYAESGLTPQNITIVTSDGTMLYDGSQESASNSVADKRLGVENEEAMRREKDLQQKLDAAFGVGNTVVSIPVLKMNFDKIRSTELVKDPTKKPVSKEEVKESMSGAGSVSQEGLAGSPSNTQPPAEASGAGEGDYTGNHTKLEFETNQKETFTEKASGDLQSMAINVLVNSSKVENSDLVGQYVTAYLAPLSAVNPESFTTQVTPVAFDTSQTSASTAAQSSAAGAARMQQMMSLLPIAALIIVALIVVKALGKAATAFAPLPRQEAALPSGGTVNLYYDAPQPLGAGVNLNAQALPNSLLNQMTPEQVVQYEQTGELADSLRNLAATMQATNQIHIESIPEKVHIPLEQLKQMAEQKPDAVANIIKTLILDERK